MADKDQALQNAGQEQYKDANSTGATMTLEQAADSLAKYGGYDVISATVEGCDSMNPAKKARKKIFLTESKNVPAQKALKQRLEMWINLLEADGDVVSKINESEEKSKAATEQLSKNIGVALEATKSLEQSYRAVDLFLKNTGEDKLKNIVFMNASHEQITDLDNTLVADLVRDEFKEKYDKLDLRKAYSLLLIPGYLGENSVLNQWGEIAHNHKVTMVTDFRDLDDSEDVIDLFSDADHTASDAFKSNVIMAANWLIGREGYPELGIDEPLTVSPASALAGKIYESPKTMAQVIAGLENGKLRGVDSVAFEAKKSELTKMESLGLVPLNNEFGAVFPMSGKTLYSGDSKGLQSYSVVRVFDWVTKVLIDFLNRKAFVNWDRTVKEKLEKQIIKFLNSITGPGKLIEKYSIKRLEQDKDNKDIVNIDIEIIPKFATRTYMLALTGKDGEEREWETDVA